MKKKLLGLLLVLTLLSALCCGAAAADAVSYVEYSWNETTGLSSETKSVTEYTEITAGTTTWNDGWYIAKGDVTIGSRVTVKGHAKLILTDGAVLTIPKGIYVPSNGRLTIYGQSNTPGTLTSGAFPEIGRDHAGIGGGRDYGGITGWGDAGAVEIHGGNVTAKGGSAAAGIGGGDPGDGGKFTLYHGTVQAEAGGGVERAAGIGAGSGPLPSSGDTIGDIRIYGGTLTVNSAVGPAMGGDVSSGSILIAGGVVNASSKNEDCAVIGGCSSATPSVSITGGVVNVQKGDAAAHLGNGRGNESNISITGGIVYKDNMGTVYGETTLEQDLQNPAEKGLVVPQGAKLIIPDGVTLTNSGTLQIEDASSLGGNGALAGEGSFTLPASIALPNGLTYTGQDLTAEAKNGIQIVRPAPIVVKGKTFAAPTGECTITPAEVKLSQTYTVTLGLQSAAFSVAKADITAVAQQTVTLTYNGQKQTPTVSVTPATVDGAATSVSYSWKNNTGFNAAVPQLTNANAGTYTLYYRVTAANHNDLIGSIPILVDKFTLTNENTTAAFAPMTYNGQPQTPVSDLEVALGGGNTETVTGVTWDQVTNVGDIPTVVGTNQNFTYDTLRVSTGMKPLDLASVTVEKANTLTYNGTGQTQNITVKEPGGNTITGYTVSGNTAMYAGTHTLTVSAGSDPNYTGSKTFDWNVEKAPLTVTAVIPETYWGEAPAITDVMVTSGTLYGSDTVIVTGLTASAADTNAVGDSVAFNVDSSNAVIGGSGIENYLVTVADTAAGSIKVIPLTIGGVTMDAAAYTYGDAVGYDSTALTATQPGGTTAKAEDLVYTYTGTANDGTSWNNTAAPTKAGSYTLTVSHKDTAHYTGKQEISFIIDRAPATVTALDKRIFVRDAAPDLSAPVLDTDYAVEGLMYGETPAVVPVLGYDASLDTTKHGDYPITVTGPAQDDNYVYTYVPGKLTVSVIGSAPNRAVKVKPAEGGTVTASVVTAKADATITLTVTPHSGYVLKALKVTIDHGPEVKLTELDGKYTFKMPHSDVTVDAEFISTAARTLPFTDVVQNDWFFDHVYELYHKGVIHGMTETTFAPKGTLTYGQALKLLTVGLGKGEQPGSSTHWAAGYLTLAKKEGWLTEDADLNAPISRLAFCRLAAKAKNLTAQPASNPFTDCTDASVLALVKAGVIDGMTETTFQPDGTLTRAQISKIIHLLVKP